MYSVSNTDEILERLRAGFQVKIATERVDFLCKKLIRIDPTLLLGLERGPATTMIRAVGIEEGRALVRERNVPVRVFTDRVLEWIRLLKSGNGLSVPNNQADDLYKILVDTEPSLRLVRNEKNGRTYIEAIEQPDDQHGRVPNARSRMLN